MERDKGASGVIIRQPRRIEKGNAERRSVRPEAMLRRQGLRNQ